MTYDHDPDAVDRVRTLVSFYAEAGRGGRGGMVAQQWVAALSLRDPRLIALVPYLEAADDGSLAWVPTDAQEELTSTWDGTDPDAWLDAFVAAEGRDRE